MLKQCGPISESLAAKYIEQLLQALVYLHGHSGVSLLRELWITEHDYPFIIYTFLFTRSFIGCLSEGESCSTDEQARCWEIWMLMSFVILSYVQLLNWGLVIHRDIKGANLLQTKNGKLKLAGMVLMLLQASLTNQGSTTWTDGID